MHSEKFVQLIDIVKRLRAPDGCPWDKKQTPETVKKYLLEETHELLEAMTEDNPQQVQEELGDLLFQVIFISCLYAEKNLFSINDVIESISAKMIRRHPHVFGEAVFHSEAEMRQNWQAIKKEEKKEKGQNDNVLFTVPKSLPALRYAQRVLDRCAHSIMPAIGGPEAVKKLAELTDTVKNSAPAADAVRNDDLIGELLLVVTLISRMAGTDAEEALKKRMAVIIAAFTQLEAGIAAKGKTLADIAGQEVLDIFLGSSSSGNAAPKKV
jgi:MazG family protein